MLKGDWRRIVALGLAIGVGIGFAFMLGELFALSMRLAVYPNQPPYPQKHPAYAEYDYQKAAEDSVIWSRSVLEAGKAKEAGSTDEKAPADKDGSHDAYDLAAQWLAATSGAAMVRLTFLQIVFGLFGLLGLGWTLYYSRETANAAIKATGIAQQTADLDRPYLVLTEMTPGPDQFISNDSTNILVAAVIKNSGSRTGIINSIAVREVEELPPAPSEIFTIDWVGRDSVTADEEYKRHALHMLNISSLPTKTPALADDRKYLFGYVRYSDIRGTIWRSGFCFAYRQYTVSGQITGLFFNAGSAAYWYDQKETEEQRKKNAGIVALANAFTKKPT